VLSVLAILASITTTAQEPATDADARRAYDAYVSAVRAAVLSGDAGALGDLVTADRVSVTARTGSVMRGRAAQIEADRVFFRGARITAFSMPVTSFRSSGPLAYATGVGTHTVMTVATGQQRVDSFQYVEVMVRGDDGRWRSQYFMNAPPETRPSRRGASPCLRPGPRTRSILPFLDVAARR
jgi:uncharacterized protein (TIGR02246 family)